MPRVYSIKVVQKERRIKRLEQGENKAEKHPIKECLSEIAIFF